MTQLTLYLQIFWVFFRMSLISFGGVFGVLPELQKMVVDQHHWISSQQFIQAFVVGQLVPGPNMAMCPLIGYEIAGVVGALIAFVGIYSGPVMVMAAGCALYYRNRELDWVQRAERALRPLVFALLTSSTILLLKQQADGHKLLAIVLAIPVLFLHERFRLNPLLTITLTGFSWFAGLHWL